MCSPVLYLFTPLRPKLMGTGRYTVQEVASILEAIDRNGSGAGYQRAELTKAISDRFLSHLVKMRV